jgi:hypothetical protein
MDGVELFGLLLAQPKHPSRGHAQARTLEATDNLADDIPADRAGLDDGQSVFQGHAELRMAKSDWW